MQRQLSNKENEEFKTENDLIFRNVSKKFGSSHKIHALHNISIEIEKGSFVCITGPSGSGKTTLLNLAGLLDTPSDGIIYIQGDEVTSKSKDHLAEMRNKTIGFIFQSHYLLPDFSVQENILLPSLIGRITNNLEWFEEIISTLELVPYLDKLPSELSVGQQQRVAIARALINKPTLILADEPASNLDSEMTMKLYQTFRRLNSDYGITFLIVTHNPQLFSLFGRIINLQDGKIISDKRRN